MSNKLPATTLKPDGKTVLTPKLRFPEFQDAGGWEAAPLGELLMSSPDYGVNAAAVPFSERLPKYLRITDIADDGTYLSDKKVSVDLEPTDGNYLDDGDIVLARTGASVGKSYRYRKEDGRLVFAGFLIRVKPDKTKLVSAYLANFLTTGQYWDWVSVTSARSGQPGINSTEYSSLAIPLPPDDLAEQQKIAECLSSVDELIAAQAQKLDTLKTHKTGLMQQLFPREGETQPRLRFPEFQDAGEWTEGRIADIAVVLQGYGFPERLQGLTSGDYPFYKVSDISKSLVAGKVFIDASANYVNESMLKQLKAKPIPEGTTIFAKIGEAIRSNRRVITTKPCLIDNNAAGIKRIQGRATDLFVYLLMETISLIDYSGGVVPAVNKSAIEDIVVKFPKIEEQQRITDCLSSLGEAIFAQTQKLDALKTHKKGLMQKLFPSPEEVEA